MERYYSNDGRVSAYIAGKAENGKTLFCVFYPGGYGEYEAHEIKLYEWAKHLHGNAPGGTAYGYFRASKTGKRIVITV